MNTEDLITFYFAFIWPGTVLIGASLLASYARELRRQYPVTLMFRLFVPFIAWKNYVAPQHLGLALRVRRAVMWGYYPLVMILPMVLANVGWALAD